MSSLIYEGFEIAYPEIRFRYRFLDRTWVKTLGIADLPAESLEAAPRGVLHNLVAHIGLSFARYFFPVEDFEHLHVEAFRLPRSAVRKLEVSFARQLNEMRFRNRLPLDRRLHITISPEAPSFQKGQAPDGERALLMNGGGKDTAVAGEILRHAGYPFTWFTVQSPITPAMGRIQICSGQEQGIHIEHRGFDPELRRLARYEDMVAPRLTFIGLLVAYLRGCRYLVMANEYSANFGNLTIGGVTINHQEGKTSAAAQRFNDYVSRYVVQGIELFSIVSPLYELQIAQIFARYPKYFPHFISCNIGHRRNFWCGECAKCAFIFIALAAFLDPRRLREIFGQDLWASASIQRWIERLTMGRKPLECVGTRKESKLALALAQQRHPRPPEVTPEVWETLRGYWADADIPALEAEILGRYDRPHNFPEALRPGILDFYARHLGPGV